ncbi:hypothetical protein T484DRAFT_2813715 [Baffinella frigidus]|nr:hypothetical protein T484DRAFT_2813715 [Cryptophyta sp. CCMP2293]
MWKNQIALRNVLGDPWPTVQKEEGFGHEIDDRIAMVASMKEVARLGSSTLTRSAETAREIQEQHMHSANADIGYTFKNNTVGPSGPRTPPGGKKGPSGDKAFPMPDKARDPTQDTPMQDPTSCGPGEWEASPGMGMREHLSPVREHMEEGGPASAWPMGERGNTCVVLDGGSKIERMEVPTGRVVRSYTLNSEPETVGMISRGVGYRVGLGSP